MCVCVRVCVRAHVQFNYGYKIIDHDTYIRRRRARGNRPSAAIPPLSAPIRFHWHELCVQKCRTFSFRLKTIPSCSCWLATVSGIIGKFVSRSGSSSYERPRGPSKAVMTYIRTLPRWSYRILLLLCHRTMGLRRDTHFPTRTADFVS